MYKFRQTQAAELVSMLTPLNRVQVNTFLHQLPQRTEFSQKGDTFFDSLQDIVDFTGGRESTNTKSNTAVGTLIAVTQCAEDVTGFEGRRRASTS